MSRGIVIGSRVRCNADGVVTHFDGSVKNEDLLRWLPYWDQIVYAGIGLGGTSISGNHKDDVKFLKSVGLFRTEIVDIRTLDLSSFPPAMESGFRLLGLAENQTSIALAAARLKLVEELSKKTGEIWAVGQAGGESLVLPRGSRKSELIDIQLVNCLPVPSPETPFQDILEFKARYQGELERLRLALDGLREKILSSCDEQRATMATLHEISNALADIHNALNCSRIQTISETIDLYTSNPSLGFWSAMSGVVASSQGIPLELGAAVGLAIPTVARFLKRTMFAPIHLPIFNSDFAYAYEIQAQLVQSTPWQTPTTNLWRSV